MENSKYIILKEYGRNINKLVQFVTDMEDKEKRTQYAYALIELMKQINPGQKDSPEYAQRLWDDLFIMSGWQLDVNSPFPMPPTDILGKKPKPIGYTSNRIKYKHYGRNVELMIQKAIEIEDEEEKKSAVIFLGRMMKNFYSTWNKENIDDVVIVDNIKELSNGKLSIDLQTVKDQNLFDIQTRDRRSSGRDNQNQGQNQNQRNRKPGSHKGNFKRRKN
jgi:hypothetical protein